MKILCLGFVALTIVLIVVDSSTIESNFEDLRDYLQQNLFFNHSKISVSCVYLSTLNLKWIKDGYISENSCDLNDNCTMFYSSLLSNVMLTKLCLPFVLCTHPSVMIKPKKYAFSSVSMRSK